MSQFTLEKGGEWAAAVDEHRLLERPLKPRLATARVLAIYAGDAEPRCQAQGLGDAGGTRAADILLVDDIYCRRRLADLLQLAADE
ncbi:MAG: hypothetical protein R2864_09030 [Syntrophotaleaceae bacterium]